MRYAQLIWSRVFEHFGIFKLFPYLQTKICWPVYLMCTKRQNRIMDGLKALSRMLFAALSVSDIDLQTPLILTATQTK